jgi:hypothetical protein
MKKTLLLFTLLMAFVCNESLGQTFFYKYMYTVNKETGAKSKKTTSLGTFDIYVTFTNNKQFCYISDKDGMSTKYGGETLSYQGCKNNIYDYMSKSAYTPERHFYFSTDFSRLNTWTNPEPHEGQMWNRFSNKSFGLPDNIDVFELRAAPEPQKDNSPDKLW